MSEQPGLYTRYQKQSQTTGCQIMWIEKKNIFYLYKRRVASITFQAYYESINKLIQKSALQRSLRDNMKLFVNRPKTAIERTSFMQICAPVWNSLLTNLTNKPSLQSFEKELARQSHINRITFNNTALVRNKDCLLIYGSTFLLSLYSWR